MEAWSLEGGLRWVSQGNGNGRGVNGGGGGLLSVSAIQTFIFRERERIFRLDETKCPERQTT